MIKCQRFKKINGKTIKDETARNSINELQTQVDNIEVPTKTSDLTNDSNFVTTAEMTDAINNAQLEGGDVVLDGYAKTTDIPTNVSQLTNDSGYITSVPDEYVTETELTSKGYATTGQIPTNISQLVNDNDYTTKKYVDDSVARLVDSAPETLDTLKELSTALGDDPNFATTIATQIGNKVDKVDGKGLSTNDLTDTLKANYDIAYTHSQSSHFDGNYNNLTNKPTIPSKTSELTNDSGYLTEHQDISNLALKSELHTHTNKTILDDITSNKINSRFYL